MALTEAENEEARFSARTRLSSSDQAFLVTQSKQDHSKLTNDFLRGGRDESSDLVENQIHTWHAV